MHAHLISISVTQFQAFKTCIVWNQFALDMLITRLLFLTFNSFKFFLHIRFYCSTSITITDSHRFDLQTALMGSNVAKETVRKQREAGNRYEKNNKRRKAEWKEHRILVQIILTNKMHLSAPNGCTLFSDQSLLVFTCFPHTINSSQ